MALYASYAGLIRNIRNYRSSRRFNEPPYTSQKVRDGHVIKLSRKNKVKKLKPFCSLVYRSDCSVELMEIAQEQTKYCGEVKCLQDYHKGMGDEILSMHNKNNMSDPTCVYRYYDKEGKLLYAGITNGFDRRDSEHFKLSGWHSLAAFARSEIFPWRMMAETIEGLIIENEKPEFNICNGYAPILVYPTFSEYFKGTDGRCIGPVYWYEVSQGKSWKPPIPCDSPEEREART